MSSTGASPAAEAPEKRNPNLMLAMATLGFALNFWAWALISPLGPLFREQGTLGQLSESDVALMVAVPVIVGSLGRIIVGALTDKFGGRVMFPVISGITIIPILFIAFFALDSYALILFGGFFLGIAGTAPGDLWLRDVARWAWRTKLGLTMTEGLVLTIVRLPKKPTSAHRVVGALARSALANLTRNEAREWAPHGIQINAVAPAAMSTMAPYGVITGEPDMASLALHLASEEGADLTGLMFECYSE